MQDLNEAARVLEIEANAINALKKRLDDRFQKAVDLLFSCEGKVVVTGMGKSGQIGRKIASTMSSTGTPAIFLHPAESSHGDLGVVTAKDSQKDVIVALSYRGETPEMNHLVHFALRHGIPL